MSFFVSRSQVKKVSSTMPTTSQIAARLIAQMQPTLSATAQALLARFTQAPSAQNLPVAAVLEFKKSFPLPDTLAPAEKIQVATLLQVASAPCLIENANLVQKQMQALQHSRTPEEAEESRSALLATLKDGHRQVFLRSLTEACTKAAFEVGLAAIEEKPGPLGERRLVATDNTGRGIVTEIRPDRNGQVLLESEVIGVKDNSCQSLMEQFDRALEAGGVRSSASEQRPTGGVSQLASAREFIRKRVECAKRHVRRPAQASPVSVRR